MLPWRTLSGAIVLLLEHLVYIYLGAVCKPSMYFFHSLPPSFPLSLSPSLPPPPSLSLSLSPPSHPPLSPYAACTPLYDATSHFFSCQETEFRSAFVSSLLYYYNIKILCLCVCCFCDNKRVCLYIHNLWSVCVCAFKSMHVCTCMCMCVPA